MKEAEMTETWLRDIVFECVDWIQEAQNEIN
jgi:hypothetical protein